jgi:hypothetical protein
MTWLVLALVHLSLTLAALRPGLASSQRLLAVTLVVIMPLAGPVLALMCRLVRGGAPAIGAGRHRLQLRRASVAEVRDLGQLPPLLDRVMSADAEERHAALSTVSAAPDREAVALLRWAVDHGSREVALDAALALEELDLRRAEQLAAATCAFEAAPSFERALAAADAAASGVTTGTAADAGAAVLVARARGLYEQALELAPQRWREVAEARARLELAAGEPSTALELIDGLIGDGGDGADLARARIDELRGAAAFAARRFELASGSIRIPAQATPARTERLDDRTT